jgi:hypothetical protein
LLVVLLAAGCATWYWLRRADHEAYALVQLTWPSPELLPGATRALGEDELTRQEYCETQATLAKSRMVLTGALRDPRVADLAVLKDQPEPVDWLEQHLQVRCDGARPIMRISLTASSHPQDLPRVVDAIAKAYLEEFGDKERLRWQDRLRMLKELARMYQDSIKQTRSTLRRLQETVGPGNKDVLALKQQYAMVEAKALAEQLATVRHELRQLKIQLETLEQGAAPEGARRAVAGLMQRADFDEAEAGKTTKETIKYRIAFLSRLEQMETKYLEAVTENVKKLSTNTLDLVDLERENDSKADLLKALNRQISLIEVQLQAPPRFRVIQDAVLAAKGSKRP